jgi:hypothetical protein
MLSSITENTNDNNSIIIKIILDDIEDNLRVVKLETPPPTKLEAPGLCLFLKFSFYKNFFLVSTYVKSIVDLLTDNSLDEEAFEAIITQYKIKYLK